MQLRNAPADHKRYANHPAWSSGERRTTSGLFSGFGDRLVHAETNGSLRDLDHPLSGSWNVECSRFGVRPVGDDTGVHWFDGGASQSYAGDGALVVADHETSHGDVMQYDLAIGDRHVSRFETDAGMELVVFVYSQPDGHDILVGQLTHGDTAKTCRAEEHDFLASSPAFEHTEGRMFEGFDELLPKDEAGLPRPRTDDYYEEG